MHYTSTLSTGTSPVADDAAVQTGGSPSAANGWVAVDRGTEADPPTAAQEISGLTNGTAYRVRVRAKNASGAGAWLHGTGTPVAVPGAPTGLTVAAGDGKLDLSWTAPSGTVTGYDVHYTSAPGSALSSVTHVAPVQTGPSPSAANGWVAVSRTSTDTSVTQSITGLDNGRLYRVRVRAKNGSGAGAWMVRGGTPSATASSDATLSNLTGNTSTDGIDFSGTLTLSPAFSPSTTSYTATVANSVTHVKLTPTANHGSAEVRVGIGANEANVGYSVTNALALDVGDNVFKVGVTAENGAKKFYTVTVTRHPPIPGAPTGLTVKEGASKLDLSWTAPLSSTVTGYDVHYTSALSTGASPVANDAAVQTTASPSAANGWVAVSRTETDPPTASQSITGLTNNTAYRVRVRAKNSSGASAWAHGTGTPPGKTFEFDQTSLKVPPGTGFELEVNLSRAAPTGGLALTLTRLLGDNVPGSLCDGTYVTKATAADLGASPPTTVTVDAGKTSATVTFATVANGDDLVTGEECCAVRLGASAAATAAGWSAGDDTVAKLSMGLAGGKLAFGTDAAATAKDTRSVAEDVSSGTLRVPVTVDALPAKSLTFTVEVLSTGTATEYVDSTNPGDFRIQTKSVTFGPDDATKTQYLSVAVTNDTDVEGNETIELRIAAADDALLDLLYARNAQGRLSTVTITDDDTDPGVTVSTASLDVTVGSSASYTVVLDSRPTANVTVTPTSGTTANATVSAGVTFTQSDWETPKTITVTGVKAGQSTVTHAVTSSDPKYPSSMSVDSVAVTVTEVALTGKTYSIVQAVTADEGSNADLVVSLGEAAPAAGIAFDVTYDYSGSDATTDDTGTTPATVTVTNGDRQATLSVPIASDALVDPNETFTVTIAPASSVTGWSEASGGTSTATVTIEDNDDDNAKIAFGSDAASETAYTATVLENVSDGSLDVPVTVSHLPGASTTFNVEVVTGGTATEDTDYSIATKSVTFGPSDTNKSKDVAIAITNDADIEDDETILLKIAAADDPANDLGDHYARHASGSTATITIDSEDAVVAKPAFSPANNTTVTDASRNITLTFTEAIKRTSSGDEFTSHAELANVLQLKQTNSSGTDITYTASIDNAKKVITINPAANLPEGAIYVAISNSYYDAAGNQGQAANATFTVDTMGPATPTFEPQNAATVTNASTNITITFTEAIKADGSGTDFTNASIDDILVLKQTDASGTNIGYSATIDSNKRVITIDPTSNLSDGVVYVGVTDGHYDVHGNQGGAANITFTVDSTGVSAPAFSPANTTTVTDASRNITLTFTEAIKRTSSGDEFTTAQHLAGVLQLKQTNSSGTDITYTASIDNAKKVITINPAANLPEGAIYVAISNSYYDAAGNQGQAANITFTVDTMGPATPTFEPQNAATVTNASTNITITFTEAIKADGSGTDFTNANIDDILVLKETNASGTNIGYSATIDSQKKVITIDPTSNLSDGVVYVGVTDGHYDAHGNQGAAANITFTVDTTEPAVPAAPTGLSVTAGDSKLDLGWTAPSGTVTGYDVHYTSAPSSGMGAVTNDAVTSGNDASAAWVAVSRTSTDTSVTQSITGLTNTTDYRVRVRAKNSAGTGAWVFGTGTPAQVAATAPGAPRNVRVTPGDRKLTIAWQAPASWGALTAAWFDLQAWAGGEWVDLTAPGPETGRFEFTQRTLNFVTVPRNGVVQRVRIRAVSYNPHSSSAEYQRGAWVTASGTPQGSPNAPTSLMVAEGDTKLDLSWTAPSGTTVTGYDVHYTSAPDSGQGSVANGAAVQTGASPTAANGWVAVARTETDPPTASQAITGLTNDTLYRVRVRAKNSEGAGNWAFGEGEPQTVPAAPTALTVSGESRRMPTLDLSWMAPAGTVRGYDVHYTSAPKSGGGSVADGAAVQTGASPSAANGWVASERRRDSVLTRHSLVGLEFGTGYRVRVRARNAAGTSPWAFGTGTPTPVPAPDAPTALGVASGNAKLVLSWTAPVRTGGPVGNTRLTHYDVHYTSAAAGTVADDAAAAGNDAATAWVEVDRGTENDPPTASQTISSLTNGAAYRVRVRAKTRWGVSAWLHGTGTPAAVPDAPTAPGCHRAQRRAGSRVDGAVGHGDGLRRALHLGGGGRGGEPRGGVGHRRVGGLGGGGAHRDRPPDALAGDHEPGQRHALPGAGAGEERRRRRRVGARHGHAGGGSRRADVVDGHGGRHEAGSRVDGAVGHGDGLRRALHRGAVVGQRRGRQRRGGADHRVALGRGRLGGRERHRHGRPAHDLRADRQDRVPGAGAGEEQRRSKRVAAWHGHAARPPGLAADADGDGRRLEAGR